jgi:hypothetical protein
MTWTARLSNENLETTEKVVETWRDRIMKRLVIMIVFGLMVIRGAPIAAQDDALHAPISPANTAN